MPTTSVATPELSSALYRATVEEAAAGGAVLMGQLINGATTVLLAREKVTRDLRERQSLTESVKLLVVHESGLRAAYPKALLKVFLNPDLAQGPSQPRTNEVNFDELELMDEVQVQSSVVMARVQQSAVLAAEASLAELNTLICGSLGLQSVRPERNPLRPDVYIAALKDVIEQQDIPIPTQLDWIAAMSVTLGQELREMYNGFSIQLKRHGVVAAGYAVHQNSDASGGRRALFALADTHGAQPQVQPPELRLHGSSSHSASPADATLLTLDKLRRLLAGELDAEVTVRPLDRFKDQFAHQFESNPSADASVHTDFASTVPAAFEALQEMQQVDNVVRRIEERQHQGAAMTRPAASSPLSELRHSLRSNARGVAQALSLEVVTLMIDKIARDPRLLPPVQDLVARLEPAFLKLSLVDARLFTDKQHPARVLLQEIAHRSMAYRSVDATGFHAFKVEMENIVAPLLHGAIESAAPFGQVLLELKNQWQSAAIEAARAREEAVVVLQHVEQRNVLAEKIAKDISSHRDAANVPPVVIEFLCGPWAQVVAQARLAVGTASSNADKYQALISALLWSTHPELTRKNIAKLTRLVPLLLGTLREGLDTIHFPAMRTAAFLEALMGLHQLAFRANATTEADKLLVAVEAEPVSTAVAIPLQAEDPWVAPDEARASNFVQFSDLGNEVPESPTPTEPLESQRLLRDSDVTASAETDQSLSGNDLPLGAWVELLADGQWVRTQLTWASPHGTLFLFTSAIGTSQSMTRRSRDRLIAAGSLRIISGAPVVEGALNSVAQIALRNSMDISL